MLKSAATSGLKLFLTAIGVVGRVFTKLNVFDADVIPHALFIVATTVIEPEFNKLKLAAFVPCPDTIELSIPVVDQL